MPTHVALPVSMRGAPAFAPPTPLLSASPSADTLATPAALLAPANPMSSVVSPVTAMGNFGGRGAGFGAPGDHDSIGNFCRQCGVDLRAECALRGLPAHLVHEVLSQGVILGVNASAILMVRVHKAEQSFTQPRTKLENTMGHQFVDVSDPVAAFLGHWCVDSFAEQALRALPADQQRQVFSQGPLRSANASAVLVERIRCVQAAAGMVRPFGNFGMGSFSAASFPSAGHFPSAGQL